MYLNNAQYLLLFQRIFYHYLKKNENSAIDPTEKCSLLLNKKKIYDYSTGSGSFSCESVKSFSCII